MAEDLRQPGQKGETMGHRPTSEPGSTGTSDGQPGAGASVPYLSQLSEAKYMLLITFKRDGTPVAAPVHVAVKGELAYFRTWNPAGKWKRLRYTQRVLIAPCTMRGRSSSPPGEATARLLSGAESAHAAQALARKHPILHGLLIPLAHRVRGWQTVQYELGPPSATDAPGRNPQ
jgi:uncharacterized protein